MSSPKSLYRSASHYLAGNVGVMLLGFVSFPLFTRSLSVAQYGVINVVMRLVLLPVALAKLGLPHSMVRFHAEDGRSPDRAIVERYYSTFVFTSIVAGLAVTLCFVLIVWGLPATLVPQPFRALLLAGSIIIFANSLNSLLTGVLRAAGRSREFAGLQVVIKAMAIGIACALLFLWERSARALVTSNVIVESLTCAILLWMFMNRGLLKLRMFDADFCRKIVTFALPLVVFELAAGVLDSGDRILIQIFLGSDAAGLYSAAYNVSTYVYDLIFSSMNQALIPIYIGIWATKGKDETCAFLSSSFNDFVLVCCLVCCGAAVCSGDALVLLASTKYQQAAGMVPTLVVGLVLYALTTFFNAGLYLHKRTGTMAGLVATSAVVNVLLNVLLLPRFGIQAAVYNTLASYAFLLAATALFSAPYLRLKVDFLGASVGIFAAVVVALAVSRLNFGRPVPNILIKGALSTIGYAALLLSLNARVRARVISAWST